MIDPGMSELETALQHFCEDVLSDLTFPTAEGLMRLVHWRYRGREFRATILLDPAESALSRGQYAAWRARGQEFAQLPSKPIFESRNDSFDWEVARTVGIWRWALRPASRRGADDDDLPPGDLAGRPVRPKHGPPTLSVSATAIPELPVYEDHRHEVVSLTERGGQSGMVW